MDLKTLLRPEIRELKPYSSARSEYHGEATVWLDANENPFPNGLNRYPDPLHRNLREALAPVKGCNPEQLALGNGSDEVLDWVFRAFCRPGIDEVAYLTPGYGMYEVLAQVQGVATQKVPLDANFNVVAAEVLSQLSLQVKVLFICSPNNPTGNCIDAGQLEKIIQQFSGIVVLDEAYQEFSGQPSWVKRLEEFPNLLVTQTFSKAWGMAGLRLGCIYGAPEIIQVFQALKAPYNLNQLTLDAALKALSGESEVQAQVLQLVGERELLARALQQCPEVVHVFPSEANFLLVRFSDAQRVKQHLLQAGIVVRDRTQQPGCSGCLRITVGTPAENQRVLQTLNTIKT